MTSQLAQDVSHLAHGKALYSLAPVIGTLPPEKREIVYRILGDEYSGFDESVQRLLADRTPAAASELPEAAR